MDQITFNYSTKNIPCAPKSSYLKCLIEKTENFLKRLRWRAFFFKNPKSAGDSKETYGFKSRRSPPVIDDLKVFEENMTNLIQNIEFEHQRNSFQNQLKSDLNSIKKDNKLTIKADKTVNYYKMEPKRYNELLTENITKNYKKASLKEAAAVNQKSREIAENLQLEDRIEKLAEKQVYITLKDHKDNFNNKPACRLINPTKSEIGHISKVILDRIINNVKCANNINLWKNTNSVIEWFKEIPNKEKHSFITFDIVDFYPSITEKLLNKALDFASQYDEISDKERDIIIHAKKTLVYNNTEPWKKKDAASLFDVTMGSYDGAETCELVVTYMLSLLQAKYGKNVGLYRDDGLSVFQKSPRQIELIKKDICKIFKENDLNITIDANKKVVDFLDITLDLNSGCYMPYMKSNNTLRYVNVSSNHPPSVLRSIPKGINKRLSDISSTKEIFDKAKPVYQKALSESGHKYELKYEPSAKRKKQRSRNIIWYNPPFDLNVKTNIGKKFLGIIDKCFPQNHPLHKICNRNTIKLSYSCMPNVQSIIQNSNKMKQNENNESQPMETKDCNCKIKNQCPVNGQCRRKNIIYQATVNCEGKNETYIGLASTEFKTRFANHKNSFKDPKKRLSTELSKHIWLLKDQNKQFEIKWKIMCSAKPYSNITKKCNLCIAEKYLIICKPALASLNRKTELVGTCRHQAKHLLGSIT